jgi:hypothetical protein
MPRKKHWPEEFAAKLRQVDVFVSRGQPVGDANVVFESRRRLKYQALTLILGISATGS